MRMEQSPYGSKRREEEADYREWSLRPHQISRDNTKSRRFSGSHIRTYRDDNATSFRSYITISSTASSPGYPFKEEIDPSTYSFTTALKALQARAGFNNNYSWECSSPDGFALNSKWNEAEKYICNPLSGEVPLECLSSKTLSGRSFRNSTSNRVTMSAPLVYNSHRPIFTAKPSISSTATPEHDETIHFPIQEKKMVDIGTQSTPPDVSSSSHSPPPLKSCEVITEEDGHFLNCNDKLKDEEKVEEKETKSKEGEREGEEEIKEKEKEQKWKSSRRKSRKQGGCLSWIRKKQTDHKLKTKTTHFFLPFLQPC